MNKEAKILIAIGVATILIIVGGALLLGGSPESQKSEDKKADQSILVREDSFKTSTESAKVELVEFADFQCPACGAYYPIVSRIKSEYSDKELNYVFRHFPLAQHKNARVAANAAEAGGAQGKFSEMEDKLFTNQKDWENSNNPAEIFVGFAKDLDLDVEKFKKEVEDKKYENKINRDIGDGTKLGVNSTPTFYLNGVKMENVRTFDLFKQKIDEELKALQ